MATAHITNIVCTNSLDRDEMIAALKKLPKGSKMGMLADFGNKLIPIGRVAIYRVNSKNQLSARGKTKAAVIGR